MISSDQEDYGSFFENEKKTTSEQKTSQSSNDDFSIPFVHSFMFVVNNNIN